MKKVKKKKKRIFKVLIPLFIFIIMALGVCFCYINVLPMQKKSQKVLVEIKPGESTKNIIRTLKKKKLIRFEEFMYVYIKINNIKDIKAGTFVLNKNLSPKEIFKILTNGSNAKNNDITVTFQEGKTMRKIAEIIDENTKNSYDEVFKTLEDKEYIQSLIKKYWFLDESILNENIYYPLEGYLAPNTYNFRADSGVKEIFEKLLDETNNILSKEKEKITASGFTPHQLVTLASIVESEGGTLEDRKNIAGVFMNRLKAGMSLGSDVTTYYAFKIELGERDLYNKEINSDNPYNTRSTANAGKLPVGPISNPSKDSIIASTQYTPNEYYYFVTDKTGKVYFSKDSSEHDKIINKLKTEGLWFEY